jgi:hypothetical protein
MTCACEGRGGGGREQHRVRLGELGSRLAVVSVQVGCQVPGC